MSNSAIYVSELSSSRHCFNRYHFCRGNSNKRKSRLGIILKGSGTYLYMGKSLRVREGDMVFIPENVYCYSEWHGAPAIEVVYVSCFMHYDNYAYEPQIIPADAALTDTVLQIAELLTHGFAEGLLAYSLFYRVLGEVLPRMVAASHVYDKTLQAAIAYITEHFAEDFSVAALARHCLISESALYHLFRRELGETPIGFLHSVRINVAIEHLENSNYSISAVSRAVGFHSENHFRRVFTDLTGMTPLKFKKMR